MFVHLKPLDKNTVTFKACFWVIPVSSLMKNDKDKGRRQAAAVCCYSIFSSNNRRLYRSFDICIPWGTPRAREHRRKHGRAWDTITPVQPNMKQSHDLGSLSRSKLAQHPPLTSFPLFDSTGIFNHCRGFGTRISGLWVHLDQSWCLLLRATVWWHWNIQDVSVSRFVIHNSHS